MAMEKESSLILAQADHLSGEEIGFAIEKLMELGAGSVHVIPTATKKNRTGALLLIDPGENEERVADFLMRELEITGYNRISVTHVFQKVLFKKKRINVVVNGAMESFDCRVKVVGEPGEPLFARAESDFFVDAHKKLNERFGPSSVSLLDLKRAVEPKLNNADDQITVEL